MEIYVSMAKGEERDRHVELINGEVNGETNHLVRGEPTWQC